MPGRDNGFVARHYLPLADLDPRLAEAMLDVLRTESIAAYVEPSTGRLGGYLEVHLPDRPHDRHPALANPEVDLLPGRARVQVARRAGAGAEQQEDLRIVELPQLVAESRGVHGRQAPDRTLDVRGDELDD